jgi:hypothetical protein
LNLHGKAGAGPFFRGFFPGPAGFRRKAPLLFFFLFRVLILTGPLSAQEGESPGEIPGEALAEESPGLTEERIIELDIRSSTLQELAAWCRTLRLSEGGGREELAGRLREHYGLDRPAGEDESPGRGRYIIIESARNTEYFTLDVVNEEYARLRGDVTISLKDEDASHKISAQEILYNRTRNQVSARGRVSYIKEEGDTIETFRGDSITVNLDSWATVLTGGISERALAGEATAYSFAGTVISRSEEEVTILKNAKITNASTPEPYWSLNATKLWLLPGSDFALRNAVLKVGEIPLLYLPFFYYPADEVVFHPVLGYRSREGNFIQTTTYILGRPKAEDLKESSLTKILGSGADMEKELQGIFLRSTGKRVTNPGDASLKLLFDFYANLGAYFGIEANTPALGILKNFKFSAGLGRTRDLMPLSLSGIAGFTPFPGLDGESVWNRSQLFSWNIPLRYRLKTSGALSGTAGEFSWDIPFYSDPFADRDFLNRAEAMDWFNIIQEGASLDQSVSDDSLLSSYEWRFNGRVSLRAPQAWSPYLTNLSLSNLSSTMRFSSRESEIYRNLGNSYSPSRQFYIPDKFTLFSLGLNLGGTPLSLGGWTSPAPAREAPEQGDPFAGIGVPRSPWGIAEEAPGRLPEEPESLSPPALGQRFELRRGGGPRFSIDYQLNPAAVSELQFRTGVDHNSPRGSFHWAEAEDVDWGEVSSVLSTIRGDGSLSFNLNHLEGLYANSFRFTGSGAFQDYLYANREAEEFNESTQAGTVNELRNVLSRVYNATFFTTSYDYTGSVKPLYQSQVWGDSNLSYSFRGLLAKAEFDPDSIPGGSQVPVPVLDPQMVWDAKPRWKMEYGAWDKERLELHQLGASVNANVMDHVQNFTLTAALPPKDSALAGNLTARLWLAELNASMQVLDPWKPEDRKLEPLYFTGTLKFGDLGSLQQYMAYDPEENEYRTLTTRFNLWGFSASFTAIHGVPYEFIYDPTRPSGNGWIQGGTAGLYPQDMRFGFNKSLPSKLFWNDRLSLTFNINTNLLIDLQRYTYSKFDATFALTLGIKDFLDLTFSTTSENTVIYRYMRDIPGFELPIASSGEENIFKDLLNSFRFDNEQLRTDSGFKLKSLNLTATHHMGDWNASLGLNLAPYLERPGGSAVPYYKFNTQIAFVVQWLPISEIKSELSLDREQWVVK